MEKQSTNHPVKAAFFLLLCLVPACVKLSVPQGNPPNKFSDEISKTEMDKTENSFSYKAWDSFLKRHVDKRGYVDYRAVQQSRADLDHFLRQIAEKSPDSDPELFPTREARLTYWINAYNAWAIQAVLTHYPIESVNDVPHPWPLFFLPRGTGFFLFQRITLGGTRTSLYYLENKVIRKRFSDPRIHFALNCASKGCPRLPREAYIPERLDNQLDVAMRQFLSEPRNLSVDLDNNIIHMSSIFDWYEKDFTRWIKENYPEEEPSLVHYLKLNTHGELKAGIEACRNCRIEFIDYDWSLNNQKN